MEQETPFTLEQGQDAKRARTSLIREVFGYIDRFENQTFVVKLHDDLLSTPLFPLLIQDIVSIRSMGIRIVLVLGAKESIEDILSNYNVQTTLHKGIRVTTEEAMPLVKLGASNVSNRVLTLLSENGVHGVVGNWVRAREVGVLEGLDYQRTGRVENIHSEMLEKLLEDDMIPILSNIGWSSTGVPYNISSNELAVSVAKSLEASKLFFVGIQLGIPAVASDASLGLSVRSTGMYSSIQVEQAHSLLQHHSNELEARSVEHIHLALDACEGGVDRVHLLDGSEDGILLQEIFSTSGQGTMFYRNVHANIRPAVSLDIPSMLHLMQPYVQKGVMVQRTVESIAENLSAYSVFSVDNSLYGCGALSCYSDEAAAELEAVVVDPYRKGKGVGSKLVSYFTEKAKNMGMKYLFALTTQSSDFFMNMGFEKGGVENLPKTKQQVYNTHRNSKIWLKKLDE
jgi:amino-acid N-acetyltransferase